MSATADGKGVSQWGELRAGFAKDVATAKALDELDFAALTALTWFESNDVKPTAEGIALLARLYIEREDAADKGEE